MSLLEAIAQGRTFGMGAQQAVPKHVVSLKLALSRFIHAEHFGKFYASAGESKPSPKHANGKNAKFKDRFTIRRLCQTLEATKDNGWFHFYVNRPDAKVWLFMLDIDLHGDRDNGGDSDAWELMTLIVDQVFGGEWDKLWTCPSRNGRGVYVYFMLANTQQVTKDMDVDQFAKKLRQFNLWLRRRYNDRQHDFNGEQRTFRATVDAVKGSPYRLDWDRYEAGDDDLINRGTLATIPLTGIRAGARDVLDGADLIERFITWVKSFKSNAFPACYFFDQMPVGLPVITTVSVKKKGAVGATIAGPVSAGSDPVITTVSVKDEGGVEGDDIGRMNRCAWNLSVELGRAATAHEVWQKYHVEHLNTDHDEDGNRWRLCSTAADWLAKNFDPTKATGKRFKRYDAADYLMMVQQHVTNAIRQQVAKKTRASYTNEQLAVVLYTVEVSSLTWHRERRKQFGVPNASIIAMMKKVGVEFDGTANTQRMKLSAMKQALTEAKLISVVDDRYTFGQKNSIGKKYGLGVAHTSYSAFIAMKNQIDGIDQQQAC